MNISSLLRRYKLSLLLENGVDVVFDDLEKEIIEILNRECEKHLDISNSVVIRIINNPLYKLVLYDKIANRLIGNNINYNKEISNLVDEWCEYYKI